MIKNIVFLFSLVFAISANAQQNTLDNLDFARKLSLETSQYIAAGDFATAAEYIKPFWPMPESEFNKLQYWKAIYINMYKPGINVQGGVGAITFPSDREIRETPTNH